jgi:hypothetical protein
MRGQSLGDESAPKAEPEPEPSLPPSPPLAPAPAPAPVSDPFAESEATPPFIEDSEPDRFSQLFADLEPVEPDADMIGDLRDQIVLGEEDLEDYDAGSGFHLSSPIPGLTPFQSFVIAVMFFANVAVCGCMILFVTGRMALPY